MVDAAREATGDTVARGDRLRIALIAPANALHTVRWANALARRGHTVALIGVHPPSPDLDPQVTPYRLTPGPMTGYVLAASAARRRLRSFQPDIVNAHYATGYGTLARLAGYGPVALSVWGSDIYAFPTKSRLHRAWVTGNIRAADAVFSTSQAMATRVLDLAPHIATPAVTPFGVDTAFFRPGAPGPAGDRVVFGTVKSLAPVYGVDRLLRAFAASLRKVRADSPDLADRMYLRIAGDGPDRSALRALAGSLGIAERTTFAGALPHRDVPQFLDGLDVFAALSRQESFGVAVLEASACARPIVATDVGGLPEVVVPGETGILVSDNTAVDDAARAFADLVRDPSRRVQLGQAGRAFVARTYDWNTCVRVMEANYRAVAGRTDGRDPTPTARFGRGPAT